MLVYPRKMCLATHNGTDMNEHHKAILSHVEGQDCLSAGYKDEPLQDVWVLQDSAGQRRLSFSAGCFLGIK